MPTLYLLPVPLTDQPQALQTLPPYVAAQAATLRTFAVENIKTARRTLRSLGFTHTFDEVTFFELSEHTQHNHLAIQQWLQQVAPQNVGLLSEAGCPGIADPGATLVAQAHQLGWQVAPLVGPSSLFLALMASGLNGQQFGFAGYLPIARNERLRALRHEADLAQKQTRLFIETPYRNVALLTDLLQCLPPHLRLCIATDITAPSEYICTRTIQQWQQMPLPDLHKRPTVFLIGR